MLTIFQEDIVTERENDQDNIPNAFEEILDQYLYEQPNRGQILEGEIESKYVPGDLVEVEITSVVDFGAFAKLPEGLQGLIHISELGYTTPGKDREIVEPGARVLTKILRINAAKKRIARSMRKVPVENQLDWMVNSY